MIYYFDIDGTITNETDGWDYENRTPRIDVIKKMWEIVTNERNQIVLWTSRLEIDRPVTVKWLKKYSVPYIILRMEKHQWDLYICDKSINIEQWMNKT